MTHPVHHSVEKILKVNHFLYKVCHFWHTNSIRKNSKKDSSYSKFFINSIAFTFKTLIYVRTLFDNDTCCLYIETCRAEWHNYNSIQFIFIPLWQAGLYIFQWILRYLNDSCKFWELHRVQPSWTEIREFELNTGSNEVTSGRSLPLL